jgi:methionyl-tRNA formyltransferase
MRIVVITQEDKFVIPKNIEALIEVPGVDIHSVFAVESKNSLASKKSIFLQGFGFFQSAKMFSVMLWKTLLIWLSDLVFQQDRPRHCSIETLCKSAEVSYSKVADINDEGVLSQLRHTSPDLIISYSAPTVFGPELLSIPSIACINLHCSLLPAFSGIMPSFWVLQRGEKMAGYSVHLMDDKIDNGRILRQGSFPIRDNETMFSLIHRTKKAGGELMCIVVDMLIKGNALDDIHCAENSYVKSYFTWPTVAEMREFRSKGGRLI